MLTQYAKSKGYKLGIYTKPQFLESVMRKYGFRDWDSVLAAIGHGGLKEGQVFNKLMEAYDKENQKNLTDEAGIGGYWGSTGETACYQKQRWYRCKRYP